MRRTVRKIEPSLALGGWGRGAGDGGWGQTGSFLRFTNINVAKISGNPFDRPPWSEKVAEKCRAYGAQEGGVICPQRSRTGLDCARTYGAHAAVERRWVTALPRRNSERFLSAQAHSVTGVMREEKASACSVRNDGVVEGEKKEGTMYRAPTRGAWSLVDGNATCT
jgi:hypothetical protein